MCTLMQKDAGIEMVAGIIAKIARHREAAPDDTKTIADWRAAVEWREKLYDNMPEQISYEEVVVFVTEMGEKYSS